MKQLSGFSLQLSGALLALLMIFAAPLFADSKAENLKPLDADRVEKAADKPMAPDEAAMRNVLEKEYRAALESRLAQEQKSYEGSLRSLWLSNAAIWAILLAFIVFQAVGVRKRAAELARLKAQRQEK